jgi:hypothetical protein
MRSRIFVYIDATEGTHNPAHNLGHIVRLHLDEGDLRPGDLFVTHPADQLPADDLISTLEIKTVNPTSFAIDLATPPGRRVYRGTQWHPLRVCGAVNE